MLYDEITNHGRAKTEAADLIGETNKRVIRKKRFTTVVRSAEKRFISREIAGSRAARSEWRVE